MAISSIPNISCSLNLGYIYDFQYGWSPERGAVITIHFDKESGQYTHPTHMQQAVITMGSTVFRMYVVASEISLGPGRRVLKVEFEDGLFNLDRYYVTLNGKGVQQGRVYLLGTDVDSRTVAQKMAASPSPVATQIESFTTFPDLQYTFEEFLTILRRHFTVNTLAPIDNTVYYSETGTFRAVLSALCENQNLSFFFENNIIKIFNPVNLTINLPSQPNDCIEYTDSVDSRATYGKTITNLFEQVGGQFDLNQTSEDGGILVRTNTLFPVGYEIGLQQTAPDLNQVVAAMFGQKFWFLYNLNQGTTEANCGWAPISSNDVPATLQSTFTNLNALPASLDLDKFNLKYEALKKYGFEIAGRYYLSPAMSDVSVDALFSWFDETEGQIFAFENVSDKAIRLNFVTPADSNDNTLVDTIVNQYYPGVNYTGNRAVYKDEKFVDLAALFQLPEAISNMVEQIYDSRFSMAGSDAMDLTNIGSKKYVGYKTGQLPQDLQLFFNTIPDYVQYISPRFDSVPVKGIGSADYAAMKASQDESDELEIVRSSEGPSVVSNTGVIKTKKSGLYTIYYGTYQDAKAKFSDGNYYGHRFDFNQISPDVEVDFTFTKLASNTYRLTRNLGRVNQLLDNPFTQTQAQGRTTPVRRVSFTMNNLYPVSYNYLTNGLIGLSVSVAGNGLSASYSFSNEMTQIPDGRREFQRFEQMIRNSAVRPYRPNKVIS